MHNNNDDHKNNDDKNNSYITATITGVSTLLARQLFLGLLFWAWTHEIHLENFLGHQKISETCAVVGESSDHLKFRSDTVNSVGDTNRSDRSLSHL